MLVVLPVRILLGPILLGLRASRPPRATDSLKVWLGVTVRAIWHSTNAGEPSTPADRKTSAGDPATPAVPVKPGPAERRCTQWSTASAAIVSMVRITIASTTVKIGCRVAGASV